jgi:hypothetical protein
LQVPPKFTQIWIFGKKICRLATLALVTRGKKGKESFNWQKENFSE